MRTWFTLVTYNGIWSQRTSSIFLVYRCDHSVSLQGRKEHIRTDVPPKPSDILIGLRTTCDLKLINRLLKILVNFIENLEKDAVFWRQLVSESW